MKPRTQNVISVCLIILVCSLGISIPTWSLVVNGDAVSKSWDASHIVPSLANAHTIHDVSRWWTGSWVHDALTYWRPIPSTIWWIEYQVFGPFGAVGFYVIHQIWHILFCLTAYWAIKQIFGEWRIALMAALLFALSVPRTLLGLPSASAALSMWIDDPEMICGILILLSMTWLWLWLNSRKTLLLAGSVATFILAVMTKEAAFIVPLLAAAVAWCHGQLKQNWRVVALDFTVLFLLLIIRHAAIGKGTMAFVHLPNILRRASWNLGGGAALHSILGGDILPMTLVCAFAAGCLARRNKPAACLAVVAGCLCYAVAAWMLKDTEDAAWMSFFVVGEWITAAQIIIAGGLLYYWAKTRSRDMSFGYLWMLIFYLPVGAGRVTDHALYLSAFGWAIWLAVPSLKIIDHIPTARHRIKSNFVFTDTRQTKTQAV